MLDDLEKSWALLLEQEEDPICLIDSQNNFLELVANSSPGFVVEKSLYVSQKATEIAYQRGRIYSKGVLGYAYYMLSEYDKALPLLQDTLRELDNVDSPKLQYRLMGTLALAHISLGNFKQALEYGFQTRDLLKKIGDRTQEAWTVHGFGLCYQEMGLLDEALKSYQDSLVIFEEAEDLNGIARALTGIGSIYLDRNEYERARPFHEKSLVLFQQKRNKSGESRAFNDLGVIYQHQGAYDKAQAFHEKSLKIRQEIGNKQSQSTSYMNLGALALARGELDTSVLLLETSLKTCRRSRSKKNDVSNSTSYLLRRTRRPVIWKRRSNI